MSKLVPCIACEKEIAKGVKKCPNCGKDQRNWFMRHKILSILGIWIAISIMTTLGGGEEDQNQVASEEKVETETKGEVAFKVGEVFIEDQLEIAVTVFEEFDTIGDPTFLGKKASEGGTLVAIQYMLKNISEEPVGMFSYPTMNLLDEKGTKYSSDIDASSAYAVETDIDNSKIFSDLNPDISVTDTNVFEVSKEKFAQGRWYIQIGDSKIQLK